MNFLIDRNLEGYAIQLLRTLANQGWLELFSIRFDLENYRGVGRFFIP